MKKKVRRKPAIYKLLAANVRRARKARGLSQESLALLAGLRPAWIEAVERGERTVYINDIEKLGWALEIEPGDLFRR
jgi:transcriptional regulator with XRE-family HTH domain